MKFYKMVFAIVFALYGWSCLVTTELFAQTKQEVYDKINNQRALRGLDSIPVSKKLERSAQHWAFFMPYSLRHNVNFLKRSHRTGAECLAIGADPVDTWLKSKPHRLCILGKGVKAMGLGYWRGKWVWRSFSN